MFTTGVAATLPSLSDQAMSTMVIELCRTPTGILLARASPRVVRAMTLVRLWRLPLGEDSLTLRYRRRSYN
ncbi:hypothetical protein [Nostoc sp.]|uniref:hypothetical protein n=1 Tax=Nostoc sp. TaxID=1180 RepID=UPI002FFC5596